MDVKVLGTGCPKCKKLYETTKKAVARSGVVAALEKVEKIDEITKYGVMATPALVINGEVRASGRVPSTDEIVGWLASAAGHTEGAPTTTTERDELGHKPALTAKVIVRTALLLFVLGSVGFLVYRGASGNASAANARARPETLASVSQGPAHKLVAYYFHRTKRCSTCRSIESQSEQALKSAFSGDLASGRLEWHGVNLDEPANEHFINDFGVTWSSLVMAEVDGGRTLRFKQLEKTWDLVRDQPALAAYVQAEAKTWLVQ